MKDIHVAGMTHPRCNYLYQRPARVILGVWFLFFGREVGRRARLRDLNKKKYIYTYILLSSIDLSMHFCRWLCIFLTHKTRRQTTRRDATRPTEGWDGTESGGEFTFTRDGKPRAEESRRQIISVADQFMPRVLSRIIKTSSLSRSFYLNGDGYGHTPWYSHNHQIFIGLAVSSHKLRIPVIIVSNYGECANESDPCTKPLSKPELGSFDRARW